MELYQCEKCGKIYTGQELLENQSYEIDKANKSLIPVCHNCKSKALKAYGLVRMGG